MFYEAMMGTTLMAKHFTNKKKPGGARLFLHQNFAVRLSLYVVSPRKDQAG